MAGGSDAVVIGAGIVGAACAYHLASAGLSVTVLDRAAVASGTSSTGEGNILVSDKRPGPQLALALWSRQLWTAFAAEVGPEAIELQPKGSLVVAASEAEWKTVAALAESPRAAGVTAAEVPGDKLPDYEPLLAAGLAGGVFFPQDAQVQPMLACATLLRAAARRQRVEVRTPVTVRGLVTGSSGAVTGVVTDRGTVRAPVVVNAAGLAAGEVAAWAGTRLPLAPRRGFVLVTEPLAGPRDAPPVRHKLYAGAYLSTVDDQASELRTAAVVETTRAGTVLIGSSRERRRDDSYPLAVLSRLAAEAVALFPFLARVRVLRAFHGYRPLLPDLRPAIGPDPHLPGLWHAAGHEGAGIGLAPATGALLATLVTGGDPPVDPAPFDPGRFR